VLSRDGWRLTNNFHSGLQVVLQTGNISEYPKTCSRATATFSVLSETVRSIQKILQERQQKAWARLLQQLQQQEKEKLQLTAAHHLERLRAGTEGERIDPLLQEGVQSLQQKLGTCIENINEILDELRCEMMEEAS